MKLKLTCLSLLISTFFFSAPLLAQTSVIVTVVDAKTDAPIPFASVGVKGSTGGGSTDNNGTVTINAKPDADLTISVVGYRTLTINVNHQTNITVRLEASSTELQDIVVVGTRSAGRVKTETDVPVDVLKLSKLELPT